MGDWEIWQFGDGSIGALVVSCWAESNAYFAYD